eukprot:6234540-Pyramimonas_sp.AAC.1
MILVIMTVKIVTVSTVTVSTVSIAPSRIGTASQVAVLVPENTPGIAPGIATGPHAIEGTRLNGFLLWLGFSASSLSESRSSLGS